MESLQFSTMLRKNEIGKKRKKERYKNRRGWSGSGI